MGEQPDAPQIGRIDVDAAALGPDGAELSDLLNELGANNADITPDLPGGGWRVVAEQPGEVDGITVLAAPINDDRTAWRIAQLRRDPAGRARDRVDVHPEEFPLRPSRAARSRGLSLRWPGVSRDDPNLGQLAVDVINDGDERWIPAGDSFYAAGILAPADDDGPWAKGVSFGYVSGQFRAFALDPGEYARIQVTIGSDQWQSVRPGPYRLYARLVDLPVRTELPLDIQLTAAMIAQFRRPADRPAPPEGDRQARERERVQYLRALRDARLRLPEVVDLISEADSDDAALAGIQRLLDCDAQAAAGVYAMQLRRLRTHPRDLLTEEIAEFERRLGDSASG
jgi:hypothetical protein